MPSGKMDNGAESAKEDAWAKRPAGGHEKKEAIGQMDETKILETIARMEEQMKAAFRRIDENKQLAESVHSLALSIERLTNAQENMKRELVVLTREVEEIKSRPAKRWESIIAAIISAVVGIVIGSFLKP